MLLQEGIEAETDGGDIPRMGGKRTVHRGRNSINLKGRRYAREGGKDSLRKEERMEEQTVTGR